VDNFGEIQVKGNLIEIPSVQINDKTVVVTGKWISTAKVRGEDWCEGQSVADPELFVRKLTESGLKADIFTIAQQIPDVKPRYKYHMDWDNVAAIPITRFEEWWEKRLPQVTRKSVRRGQKRGVVAKVTEFNDELVRGIVGIHNETLIKQGTPFTHYGKDFSVVKQEYGTYLDRSDFLGAYYKGELIGIIKLVYMGKIASIMQILTMDQHYDKRPTNILIAKAVEVCEKKGISFLVYGKYIYGNKTNSSLTEFKRRNGFEQIDFPRYYIPLTLKGRIALKLKLHLGLIGMLPGGFISFVLALRSRYYQIKLRLLKRGRKVESHSRNERPPEIEDKDD
jgi:hypothetical protein